jgi:hypothetical protein
MKKMILLFLLFAAACGPSTESPSILDRSSCDLPCWNGIIVGKTTEEDALKIIKNLPDVNRESIRQQKSIPVFENWIRFSFGYRHPLSGRSKLRGDIFTTHGIVSDLTICGDIKTSIGRLVEAIGEPEHLISGNIIPGGRSVTLIDSQDGISYGYTTDLDHLEITRDTPLDCIDIFDVSFYDEMLEAGLFSGGGYDAAETQRAWYAWDRYGNLDEKYPPRVP